MERIRKLRMLVLLFALVVIFAGGFTIMSAPDAQASYACCIWVMYCPVAMLVRVHTGPLSVAMR